MTAFPDAEAAYHELCGYTLTHGGRSFIHQHVVDAFAAQYADAATKPIKLTFALVGLYLHVERGVTGREVQRVHMRLAERKRTWPTFPVPAERCAVTPGDVLAAPEGPAREAAIDTWCAAVWATYGESRETVIQLLAEYGIG